MENDNIFSKKLETPKLLALLIALSLFGVGLFVGVFLALGKGESKVDPLTQIEINRVNKNDGIALRANSSTDIILNSKVKTWHYDAGRIIGPTINLLSARPADNSLYPKYCKDIKDRTQSLSALNTPPANDLASAWGNWLKSLKDVESYCERGDWNGVSLKVTASGSFFDLFYRTVARYDSSINISAPKAVELPANTPAGSSVK